MKSQREPLPRKKYESFRRNNSAYKLWLHASLIHNGWNAMKYLSESEGPIDGMIQTAREMNSYQWPSLHADPPESPERKIEAWWEAFLGVQGRHPGHIAKGLRGCENIMKETHRIIVGFRQIQAAWGTASSKGAQDVGDLASRLLSMAENLQKLAEDLAVMLEPISKACWPLTRILHLDPWDPEYSEHVKAVGPSLTSLRGYLKQYRSQTPTDKSDPYFWIGDLTFVCDQKHCDKAIKDKTPSRWSVSGLHLTFRPPSDIGTAQRSVLDLSGFGFSSLQTTSRTREGTSLSLVTSPHRNTSENLSGIPIDPASTEVSSIALQEGRPAGIQGSKPPPRTDSLQTPLTPPLPRRSSRRLLKRPRGAQVNDPMRSARSGFQTTSCPQGGTESEAISLDRESPERGRLDAEATHASTYESALGPQSTMPRHSYDSSSFYSS